MDQGAQGGNGRREFAFRLVATAALVVGLLALWHVADFIFLAFGAILFAVLLSAPAGWINTRTRMPYKLALALVIIVFFGLLIGGGWLFAPRVSEQFSELATYLPQAVDRVTESLKQYSWVQTLMSYTPQADEVVSGARSTLSKLGNVFMGTVDTVTGIVVIIFVGIFLAASPQTYVSGVLHLFPKAQRPATRSILGKIGHTLRYWLVGQSVAMLVIGVATWAGLALLDVRLAVGLAVVAGLLEFIPTVGPILSAIPAILIALLDSPKKALYVTLLYIGIQFAENHLVVPLVQRRAVNLPPALSLLAILLFTSVFGFLGLLFAIPMTAALFVVVREAFVKRTLNDPLQ